MAATRENNTDASAVTFGRYKALKVLGEGSMGRVYLAEDPVLQRRVAVKVIAVEKQLEDKTRREYLKRFIIEARLSAKLNHPSIVTVHDAGEENGMPWIAFEFVKGESLTDILTREKRLKINKAVSIALDIASALQQAHTHTIIHRDIKPANILIDSVTKIAKLADFGIVKAPFTALTQEGKIIGSPGYMSPEQIKGEALDGRSDLFSLGVVLYMMVSGKHPFLRDTVINTLYATINGGREPIRQLVTGMPPALETAITRSIASDRETRFKTAAEFIKALNAVEGSYSYSVKKSGVTGTGNIPPYLQRVLPSTRQVRKLRETVFSNYKKITRAITVKRVAKDTTRTGFSRDGRAPGQVIAKGKALAGIVYSSLMQRAFQTVHRLPFSLQQKKVIVKTCIALCLVTILSLGLSVTVRTIKNAGRETSAQQAGKKQSVRGLTAHEKERIAECGELIRERQFTQAVPIIKELTASKSTAAFGSMFLGRIALRQEEHDSAAAAFKQALKQRRGKTVIRKNRSAILSDMEPALKKGKARQVLIDLVAVTLAAADDPIVNGWIENTRYWLRWNGVLIREAAGLKVDMVAVYILDLEHGGSMKTRINAAQSLGESGDDRAIKPLTEAREKGFRDPFVATTAASMLEKYYE